MCEGVFHGSEEAILVSCSNGVIYVLDDFVLKPVIPVSTVVTSMRPLKLGVPIEAASNGEVLHSMNQGMNICYVDASF